ncbi:MULTISPECIES: BlaI/MecI/CopY family transcriptional regulator [Paenibacillus]|uniref:BlaI/MecI/CopY family transcriptional regulator n=1 Tax=Paenibacillus baimaensis TaxID=2982185 RepID=A0ABT2UAP5_9BACL|nr:MULTISPECIES: BlaI/MecI/CopY family transcriptional regulator [unclassified Paenibacillus]MCU6791647.1 BlaI/MecI/CopY family transcriptional regulator [Paenibacillus sp. WQ 127069]OMF16280.1 transcriptional regulator [Paenibacillus sp. FSL H7-0331]
MKIQNFKYHERGLNRFFGPLEAKIMNILWDSSELAIKDVQAKLDQDQTKPLNFNTVMTVMNRLVDKGFLTKRTEGRTGLYQPMVSRDHFLENQSKELTHELIEEFGPLVVNHMLDALEEVDADLIAKLEQKIKALKKDN